MRRYRFRAVVTLDPAAPEGSVRDFPGMPYTLTAHACLVEPRRHHYFPAVISRLEEPPLLPAVQTVVTVTLADGEAEAFFAPGQRFTIWADGVVGRAIWVHGLVGRGVITGQVSLPSRRAGGDGTPSRAPGRGHYLTPVAPAVRGRAAS